jgi:hypothetical protein
MSIAKIVVALACVVVSNVNADCLEDNPYTPGGEYFDLNRSHPALGYKIPRLNESNPTTAPVTVTPVFASTSGSSNGAGSAGGLPDIGSTNSSLHYGESRRLERTAVDIQRLEQYFKKPLEYNIRKLPRRFEFSPVPWPGSYWPIYADGINVQWADGQPSASQKYARAFGLNPTQLANQISAKSGILSQRGRPTCVSDRQCARLGDKSRCGRRAGESRGVCIPSWFGICHAWAPAAILEPEPKCSVQKNGVTFEPMDLKALITQVYDGASLKTVFTGARYNGRDNDISRDQYGRYINAARRDLGAGFFHLAITNIMGRYKHPIIVDVDSGSAVWNQPVRGFRVLTVTRMKSMSDAARVFFNGARSYPFNSEAVSLAYVKTRFSWMKESGENESLIAEGRVDEFTQTDTHEYLLELDANDNIIGGEWVGASKLKHPDFLWFPTGRPSLNTMTKVGLSYRNIRDLLIQSAKGDC